MRPNSLVLRRWKPRGVGLSPCRFVREWAQVCPSEAEPVALIHRVVAGTDRRDERADWLCANIETISDPDDAGWVSGPDPDPVRLWVRAAVATGSITGVVFPPSSGAGVYLYARAGPHAVDLRGRIDRTSRRRNSERPGDERKTSQM